MINDCRRFFHPENVMLCNCHMNTDNGAHRHTDYIVSGVKSVWQVWGVGTVPELGN